MCKFQKICAKKPCPEKKCCVLVLESGSKKVDFFCPFNFNYDNCEKEQVRLLYN